MIGELIKKTRTVRRYREDKPISREVIEDLVDISRFGGSAGNTQPLRYMIVTDIELCERIFPNLGWAGYLTDWPGPGPGERPTAYIICLLVRDRCLVAERLAYFDLGISTQNMLLAAAEKGIYGCRIGSINKRLSEVIGIDEDHEIMLVLALGYPTEKVVLEDMKPGGDIKYWRDENGIHHVPKRSLDDIIYPPVL